MELNPNNKVVQQARDQWHKICVLLMLKFNVTEVKIYPSDLKRLMQGNCNIVLDAREESGNGFFLIKIVDDKTAEELARQEGGRTIDN